MEALQAAFQRLWSLSERVQNPNSGAAYTIDSGKENGKYDQHCGKGYIGIMEKKMETTPICWVNIGDNGKMETTIQGLSNAMLFSFKSK